MTQSPDMYGWKIHRDYMVREALAEDRREGGQFDAEGFSNFFPEEAKWMTPAQWEELWLTYIRTRNDLEHTETRDSKARANLSEGS